MSSGSSSFKIVVVVVGGRPTTFGAGDGNVLLEKVDALVWAGRPGEEGGNAIVNLLVGGFNPSGKLNAIGPEPWVMLVLVRFRGTKVFVANGWRTPEATGKVNINMFSIFHRPLLLSHSKYTHVLMDINIC